MKKYFSPIVGACALMMMLFGITTSLSAAPSYLQLAANTTQMATTNTAGMAQMANIDTLDDKMGTALSWDMNSPNMITVNEDGAYFLMTVAQVGSIEGISYAGADVTIWNTMNGKMLKDSGSWVYASSTARAKTIVSQTMIRAKKGDQVGFMYSSSAENGGLVARQPDSMNNLPNAPALTITMFKVN